MFSSEASTRKPIWSKGSTTRRLRDARSPASFWRSGRLDILKLENFPVSNSIGARYIIIPWRLRDGVSSAVAFRRVDHVTAFDERLVSDPPSVTILNTLKF